MSDRLIFENLGFTGGSIKGTAYVGVAKALQDTNLIDDIKRVSGVSAGSIFATLLALNFTPEEMKKVMLDLDFNKFADGSYGNIGNVYRLLTNKGMHSGKYCHNWLQNLIEEKTGDKDFTFGQMHNSGKYLDLYIVSANLNTQMLDIFSPETTPDISIADAIRCSMSIPLFFEPYVLNNYTYVDGGVIDNYPIELFDAINYDRAKTHEGDYFFNSSTLGFALTDPVAINSFRKNMPEKIMSTDSEMETIKAILNIMLQGAQFKEMHKEFHRTVYVSNLGVGMLDFNLSQEDKKNLMKEGYISTIDFLKEHNLIDSSLALNDYELDLWLNNNNVEYPLDRLNDHIFNIGETSNFLIAV